MAKNEAIQKGFHHHPIPVNGSSDHLMYRQKCISIEFKKETF